MHVVVVVPFAASFHRENAIMARCILTMIMKPAWFAVFSVVAVILPSVCFEIARNYVLSLQTIYEMAAGVATLI